MEYTVPPCPAECGTSVYAFIAWTAAMSTLAIRCQATAIGELAMPCEDLDCGDLHVCDRCSMSLDMAGIKIEMMLSEYVDQARDVVIKSLSEYDPFGFECLTNLVSRNIQTIQM